MFKKLFRLLANTIADAMKWWEGNWGEVVIGMVLLVCIILIVWIVFDPTIGGSIPNRMAEAACLERGFPDFRVADDVIYCVRIVDGSQQVVRLDLLGQ